MHLFNDVGMGIFIETEAAPTFGSRFANAQAAIFFAKPYSINFLDCGVSVGSSFRNPNQNTAAMWRIFSSNESAPANRKTGFYADCDPNKQEAGVIFA